MKPTDLSDTALSRRDFLRGLAASSAVLQNGVTRPASRSLDRRALVQRHNPIIHALDPLSPLSIGNGEFAFTADVTGLQTFPEEHERSMPLCTMSQWGWHTTPRPAELRGQKLRLTMFESHGRKVGYAVDSTGQSELYKWLRENPHRLHLGRIGLRLASDDGRQARAADLSDIDQRLDLWSGMLRSRFRIFGELVSVTTAVHPLMDLLAVTVESELAATGRLAVTFEFPYGSPSMQAADWSQPAKHSSVVTRLIPRRADIHRSLDGDEYFVAIGFDGGASLKTAGPHHFILAPASGKPLLKFVAVFSSSPVAALPAVEATMDQSARHWSHFWENGAAVELADSRDRRALELERRVVLSQYLTAIQCAGSTPPQETGLTVNSWYGKFHLEMHWWHAAHFALWNRTSLLEKSLGWYQQILPVARALAASQGYAGARWPKMTGRDGRDSPSPIGPLLIWQQPHPIFYAELCYQQRRDRTTLERYRQLVFQTADFMASFAAFEAERGRYVLGPPVIPAQENHPPRETWNPAFELEYWRYGLKIAQRWRARLGLAARGSWNDVIRRLSPLPERDGVYLAHENCPETHTDRNYDHPSMLAAYGMLPGEGVSPETMRRTLKLVMRSWQWERTWGWDYPLVAMTAARLGEPEQAINALLMETGKNRYLANGHNWQRGDLPCYLPGNGGLLYAVALMTGGWQGAPRRVAPGFPNDGSWTVRAEGFKEALLATL